MWMALIGLLFEHECFKNHHTFCRDIEKTKILRYVCSYVASYICKTICPRYFTKGRIRSHMHAYG